MWEDLKLNVVENFIIEEAIECLLFQFKAEFCLYKHFAAAQIFLASE